MTDEPTLDDVKREFPDWVIYKATDRRWRARLASATPPVEPVVGEDLLDLTNMIRRRISQIEEAAYRQQLRRP